MADDANTEELNKEDAKEVTGVAPTLDQVHQISQNKVDEEDFSGDKGDGDVADEDAKDDAQEDDADGGTSTEADEDAQEEDKPEPVAPPVEPEKPVEQPSVDTDITKPGESKIAIRSIDGKTYYFNNREEVPDDFEPTNYKELMNASTAFAKKEQADEAIAAANEEARVNAETEAENQKRVESMTQSWENDAKSLTESGLLPKDPKANEEAKNKVYDYMDAEMKKGNVYTSFNQAFKAMMWDEQQKKAKAEKRAEDEAKKKRGGMVQPGSGGSSAPSTSVRGNRIIEAPPTGAGLDAIHRKTLETLA